MITGTREAHENEASYSSDPSSGWRRKLRELTISDPKRARGDSKKLTLPVHTHKNRDADNL